MTVRDRDLREYSDLLISPDFAHIEDGLLKVVFHQVRRDEARPALTVIIEPERRVARVGTMHCPVNTWDWCYYADAWQRAREYCTALNLRCIANPSE